MFKGLANAGANNNIGSITVDNAGDKFYIVAYDDDDQGAHIYYANSAAVLSDTSITVNEVQYIAFIDGAVDDVFAQGATLKMFDFTTLNSGY